VGAATSGVIVPQICDGDVDVRCALCNVRRGE